MIVEIDDRSGFCFGVVNAISLAEESLCSGVRVYSLGDIVHNRLEVQRLEALGLQTVQHDRLPELQGKTLLIRAHGEPPATYALAEETGIRIIDATCPVVARLQQLVIEAHARMREVNGQVVILGKKGHAEVVGLTGQVQTPTVVVEKEEDLDALDYARPIFLLSQTTQSLDLFRRMEELIRVRGGQLTVRDTICRQVASREEHLRAFASGYDAVIFVCGRKSSNGKVLYEVCRTANPRCYNVEDESELKSEWFEGCLRVGICGATSTPKWLMGKVAEEIKRRF